MRCPRDPTLDPQFVWKGKDEQDAGGAQQRELEIAIPPGPRLGDT